MTDRVYEFLNAPKETARKIKAKKMIRAEKLMGATGGAIRYDLPRVQTSPQDRMCQLFAEVDELDTQIAELKALRQEQKRQIQDAADRLENDLAGRVVVLHYVDDLRWSDVARAVHKSESTVFRLHRQAADEFEAWLSTIC